MTEESISKEITKIWAKVKEARSDASDLWDILNEQDITVRPTTEGGEWSGRTPQAERRFDLIDKADGILIEVMRLLEAADAVPVGEA